MRIVASHRFASISNPGLSEPPGRASGRACLRGFASILALATVLATSPIGARADIAVSSNDGHTTLDKGVLVQVKTAQGGTSYLVLKA